MRGRASQSRELRRRHEAYDWTNPALQLAGSETSPSGTEAAPLSWQIASETRTARSTSYERRSAPRRVSTRRTKQPRSCRRGRHDGSAVDRPVRGQAPPYAAVTVRSRLVPIDRDGRTSFSNPVVVARSAVKTVELLDTNLDPARRRRSGIFGCEGAPRRLTRWAQGSRGFPLLSYRPGRTAIPRTPVSVGR